MGVYYVFVEMGNTGNTVSIKFIISRAAQNYAPVGLYDMLYLKYGKSAAFECGILEPVRDISSYLSFEGWSL